MWILKKSFNMFLKEHLRVTISGPVQETKWGSSDFIWTWSQLLLLKCSTRIVAMFCHNLLLSDWSKKCWCSIWLSISILRPLSGYFTKWSNTLKEFVGICLSVFDRFVGLGLKGFIILPNFVSKCILWVMKIPITSMV